MTTHVSFEVTVPSTLIVTNWAAERSFTSVYRSLKRPLQSLYWDNCLLELGSLVTSHVYFSCRLASCPFLKGQRSIYPRTVDSQWLKIDLMSVKYYCLPEPVFHFWPKLTNPATAEPLLVWLISIVTVQVQQSEQTAIEWSGARDCNPGLEFSIPGFGIVEFPIPGSRDPVGIGVV